MPTYEYECRSCGAGFDIFQSMSDEPLTVCPSCGKSIRRTINGGTGIIFKGSGFYVNDSRKADRDGRASEKSAREGAPAKSDAGTATASPPATSSASSSSPSPGAGPKKEAT